MKQTSLWNYHKHDPLFWGSKGYAQQVPLFNTPITIDNYSTACVISTETPASLSKEDPDAPSLVIYLASSRAQK